MIFRINGVDMLPYVAYRGIKWKRSDLDSPGSGRTLDGMMHRSRVASKIRLDVTCRPLRSSEAAVLLQAIYPESVSVEYTDPQLGVITATMYSNNNPASYMIMQDDGTEWWDGIEFPLIEY